MSSSSSSSSSSSALSSSSSSSSTSSTSTSSSSSSGPQLSISISASPQIQCVGSPFTIEAKVTINGAPVQGETVSFTHGDDAVTDASGVATTTFTPADPGLYAFIGFAGTAQSLAEICSAVKLVAVKANGARYGDGEKIFVCKGAGGAKLTLEAVPSPDPEGLWPDDQPTWSGHATPAISLDVPIDTTSADTDGTSYSVTCCDTTITVKVVVCEVNATPIPVPGNDPDISPSMCLNAQAAYQKARWKMTVKPTGTTATLLVFGNALGSIATVVDNQEVEVTPNAPDVFGAGEYGVQVIHKDVPFPFCQVRIEHLKVFKFVFKDISVVHGPVTLRAPAQGPTFKKTTAGTKDPRSFETTSAITLHWFIPPISMAAFTQTATWQYTLLTDPADSFAGEVECETLIRTVIPEGAGYLVATGVLAVGSEGASTSQIDFSDEISVSGLANGNGTAVRSFSAQAPTDLVVPFDAVALEGDTVWLNDSARYTVGDVVTVEDKVTMSASRGGAFQKLPRVAGYAKVSGFLFFPGEFIIK